MQRARCAAVAPADDLPADAPAAGFPEAAPADGWVVDYSQAVRCAEAVAHSVDRSGPAAEPADCSAVGGSVPVDSAAGDLAPAYLHRAGLAQAGLAADSCLDDSCPDGSAAGARVVWLPADSAAAAADAHSAQAVRPDDCLTQADFLARAAVDSLPDCPGDSPDDSLRDPAQAGFQDAPSPESPVWQEGPAESADAPPEHSRAALVPSASFAAWQWAVPGAQPTAAGERQTRPGQAEASAWR